MDAHGLGLGLGFFFVSDVIAAEPTTAHGTQPIAVPMKLTTSDFINVLTIFPIFLKNSFLLPGKIVSSLAETATSRRLASYTASRCARRLTTRCASRRSSRSTAFLRTIAPGRVGAALPPLEVLPR